MPVSNNKKYHLLLLGDDSELRKKVSSKFKSICLDDFKLDENSLWIDNNPENIGCYNDLVCCVYFAREYASINNKEDMMLSELVEYSMPVIPVIENDRVINYLPECIKNLNVIIQDKDSDVCLTIVSNICRFFGLIRSERRVFISYARMDSAGIALQLFDALNQRGYNVFLDTASIEKGEIFQDELWHQMADSDLVVMLNTKNYAGRHWCREEYIKAMAHRIGILAISWPDADIPKEDAWKLTGQYKLDEKSITSKGLLKRKDLNKILYTIESFRISNLASRKTFLIREFICAEGNEGRSAYYDAVENIIHTDCSKDYLPVTGIPKSNQFNEARKKNKPLYVLYSSAMIRKELKEYLEWINSFNLPVKTYGIQLINKENEKDG